MNRAALFLTLILSFIITDATAQQLRKITDIFETNSPDWVQTNGPAGGFIGDIEINPTNSQILYAAGGTEGIYRSENGGLTWEFLAFPEKSYGEQFIEFDPFNPAVIFTGYENLSKSTDGGQTWTQSTSGISGEARIQKIVFDPVNASIMYCAAIDNTTNKVLLYTSANSGNSWIDITGDLATPEGSEITALECPGNGKLFVSINDRELQDWHKGKVFKTEDDGQSWNEVLYGTIEDRFIYSMFVNPDDVQEIWISEGPLYNDNIDQPYLFKSANGGTSWSAVQMNVEIDNTQIRVIGGSAQRIYVAGGGGLVYTEDGGTSFTEITPNSSEFSSGDLTDIAVHPDNADILYLPLRAAGIAYTTNNGLNWEYRHEGIIATSINIMAGDPQDPAVVYASSNSGEGTFRSDDFGESWTRLNSGGIVHPWGDELTVDPKNPDNVWFISDVPYIHKSSDKGANWNLMNQPYQGDNFNFSSVYAMDFSSDPDVLFALNNGFGIFKGDKSGDLTFDWTYLNLSDIDYTYSIAVDKSNPNTILSGYTRKPFETSSKIRASFDGGDNWETVLEVPGSEAITSVAFDPTNSNNAYAVSTGDDGGKLWKSSDNGQTWQELNSRFNFTTIHSFAAGSGTSTVAYAGSWGGGTFKTSDSGQTWTKLSADEVFSTAALAIDPVNPDIIYAADRSAPVLYKSSDGGSTWTELFNAGGQFRRLMNITVDPLNTGTLYVSVMAAGGFGMTGNLFKLENGTATDITGTLPRLPLTVVVDGSDSDLLYTVLHEIGVYKSDNGGTTWTDISGTGSGLPESGFNNLFVDPEDSSTLYLAGGCDVRFSTFASAGLSPDIVNGVYKSTDGGLTWANINATVLGENSGAVKNLAFAENSSQIIYAGTETGVYYTTDGGTSWQFSSGLDYTTLGGVSVSGSTIYAYTNGAGVYTGTINGDYSITWNSGQGPAAKVHFGQVMVDPQNGQTIYASAYPGGVFKSTDGGTTWHEKNFGMASFKVDDPLRQGYYAMDIVDSNPDILFLGLYGKGVYRSFNGGDTWYPVNGSIWEMYSKKITSIIVDPSNPDIVYVGAEEGVFKTTNAGTNWTEISTGLPESGVRTLAINSSNQVYAGTRGYGLFLLQGSAWEAINGFGNFGITWPMWDDRPMYQYTSMLIHPTDNSKMMIGTFPQGIYKSTDGGNTWKESNVGWTFDGVFSLISHPDNPEIVYSGTYNGVNRSLDFGDHWEMWDNGWSDEQWVFSIDFDPVNPDIMYACSKNGEDMGRGSDDNYGTVMKTVDGGENWFEILNGLTRAQEYFKIVVDRFDRNTVYLASESGGMYISRNGGDSWTQWNEGLTNMTPGSNGNNVTNMLVLSADHSILYFGSASSGVFRRMITPILPVNNLGASVVNNSITLNWKFEDLNNNFSQFNIYRAESTFENLDGLSPYASVSTMTETQYTDNNIVLNTQYYYAVTTVDNNSYENPRFYVLGPVVVNGVSIVTTALDSATVGVDYSDTLSASGGTGPYTWSVIVGSLPSGLSLAADTGIISGTPPSAGDFSFTVEASDSQTQPLTSTQEFTITVMVASDVEDELPMPKSIALKQNYPNPFNPVTTIQFELPTAKHVKLVVYNVLGKEVDRLVDRVVEAGYHNLKWDASSYPSGIYFYTFRSGDTVLTRKMILMKEN